MFPMDAYLFFAFLISAPATFAFVSSYWSCYGSDSEKRTPFGAFTVQIPPFGGIFLFFESVRPFFAMFLFFCFSLFLERWSFIFHFYRFIDYFYLHSVVFVDEFFFFSRIRSRIPFYARFTHFHSLSFLGLPLTSYYYNGIIRILPARDRIPRAQSSRKRVNL